MRILCNDEIEVVLDSSSSLASETKFFGDLIEDLDQEALESSSIKVGISSQLLTYLVENYEGIENRLTLVDVNDQERFLHLIRFALEFDNNPLLFILSRFLDQTYQENSSRDEELRYLLARLDLSKENIFKFYLGLATYQLIPRHFLADEKFVEQWLDLHPIDFFYGEEYTKIPLFIIDRPEFNQEWLARNSWISQREMTFAQIRNFFHQETRLKKGAFEVFLDKTRTSGFIEDHLFIVLIKYAKFYSSEETLENIHTCSLGTPLGQGRSLFFLIKGYLGEIEFAHAAMRDYYQAQVLNEEYLPSSNHQIRLTDFYLVRFQVLPQIQGNNWKIFSEIFYQDKILNRNKTFRGVKEVYPGDGEKTEFFGPYNHERKLVDGIQVDNYFHRWQMMPVELEIIHHESSFSLNHRLKSIDYGFQWEIRHFFNQRESFNRGYLGKDVTFWSIPPGMISSENLLVRNDKQQVTFNKGNLTGPSEGIHVEFYSENQNLAYFRVDPVEGKPEFSIRLDTSQNLEKIVIGNRESYFRKAKEIFRLEKLEMGTLIVDRQKRSQIRVFLDNQEQEDLGPGHLSTQSVKEPDDIYHRFKVTDRAKDEELILEFNYQKHLLTEEYRHRKSKFHRLIKWHPEGHLLSIQAWVQRDWGSNEDLIYEETYFSPHYPRSYYCRYNWIEKERVLQKFNPLRPLPSGWKYHVPESDVH